MLVYFEVSLMDNYENNNDCMLIYWFFVGVIEILIKLKLWLIFLRVIFRGYV